MLDAIRQMADDYYNSLPNNIPKTVVASALLSFTATILLARKIDGVVDISRGVLNAAIAASASSIHALVTPLFKQVFNTWHTDWIVQFAQMTFVTVVTSAAINAVSNSASTSFPLYSAFAFNLWRAIFNNGFQNTENSEYLYYSSL